MAKNEEIIKVDSEHESLTMCPKCGLKVMEVMHLPEGQEDEIFTCPNCDTPLGTGLKIVKAIEPLV